MHENLVQRKPLGLLDARGTIAWKETGRGFVGLVSHLRKAPP